MRDYHLRFCLKSRGWYDGLLDLLEDGIDSVPDTGGAYVLGTSDGTMLKYPWGSSPIFYIGKANNLQRRLNEHRNHIVDAIDDHDVIYWWPRYQYGAAFGANCAYYSRHGPQEPQNLEARLVMSFYESFGSIPAANSYWPHIIRPNRGEQG